ncbi:MULTISPECIES: hypothetical protein [Bacillaceae]|uniref:WYL domain-containing protein n=1 Tax=Peribacillus simplex TaxID=1478 RepID=A0A109MVF6_9BACI|nr:MULTISPECIES: hypothetical protein [Bacillaceae]KWW16214.1 hypothetical protein AS888_07355 [Peribacillus simplex]PJN86828.1 hypothetical protein CVN76_27610 [Bacillus sp. mrc49]
MKYILRKHMEEKVPLEIIYLSEQGKITQRKIQVLEIYPGHIHAFCFLRQTKRTFKMNNILSARLIKAKYDRSG